MDANEVKRLIAESLRRICEGAGGLYNIRGDDLREEAARLDAAKVERPLVPQCTGCGKKFPEDPPQPEPQAEWPKRARQVGTGLPAMFVHDERDGRIEVYPSGAVGKLVEALERHSRNRDALTSGDSWRVLDDFRAALRGGGK